jgi:hypothetical protein
VGGNDEFVQFVVALEIYEDASDLVVSCWEKEEGGVSHLKSDDT